MKADFPALWAESPSTLRREPTNAEMAGGFPCGDLDINLFNELFYRLAQSYREVAQAISQNGQSPSAAVLNQLSQAIRRPLFAIDTGAPNHLVLAVQNWDSREGCLITARIGAGNTNTGATDVAIGGTAALPVTYADGSALSGGEIIAGREILLLTAPAGAVLLSVKPISSAQITNQVSTAVAQTAVGKGLFSDAIAGARTWPVPAGIYWVYCTVVGGGAGGSGGISGATRSGAGGGAGGSAEGWIQVTPGQTIAYVVGAGSAGVAYQTNSANGGTSSIGSTLQATGGQGTYNNGLAGGAGGSGTGGQSFSPGGAGTDGDSNSINSPGGAGGSSSLGGGGRASTQYNAAVNDGRASGSGGGGIYLGTGTYQGGNGADGYVSFQY